MPSNKPALTRRLALILGLTAAATTSPMRTTSLRANLAAILPRQLNPARLGAVLHAAASFPRAGLSRTFPNCAFPDRAALAARIAEDFAAGRVVTAAFRQR